MSPEQLNNLAQLADNASPGPWEPFSDDYCDITISSIDGMDGYTICADICEMRRPSMGFMEADAAFIAAARTAVPELIEALRAAELKLATIRAMATRGVPNCINLYTIDRVLNEPTTPTMIDMVGTGKEVPRG